MTPQRPYLVLGKGRTWLQRDEGLPILALAMVSAL